MQWFEVRLKEFGQVYPEGFHYPATCEEFDLTNCVLFESQKLLPKSMRHGLQPISIFMKGKVVKIFTRFC